MSSPAAKPVSWPLGADDTVARHDDAQRVLAVGGADGTCLVGVAELLRLLPVADRLAVRDRAQHHAMPIAGTACRADRAEGRTRAACRRSTPRVGVTGSIEQRGGRPRRARSRRSKRSARRLRRPTGSLAGPRSPAIRRNSPTGESMVIVCNMVVSSTLTDLPRDGAAHTNATGATTRPGVRRLSVSTSTPSDRRALRTPMSVGRNTSGSPRARIAT